MPNEPSVKPKGLAAATVAKVRDLINYQDDAVVSREIIKKPEGNVTLFAFDEGQGLTEHTSPFDALVHVLEGVAEITIARLAPLARIAAIAANASNCIAFGTMSAFGPPLAPK